MLNNSTFRHIALTNQFDGLDLLKNCLGFQSIQPQLRSIQTMHVFVKGVEFMLPGMIGIRAALLGGTSRAGNRGLAGPLLAVP